MKIRELDTNNKKDVRLFINLPFEIYRENPYWVPPLENDVKALMDRYRHPFYKESEVAFFMAFSGGGEALGRITVLDNRRFNEYTNSKTAFFYLFESINEFSVTKVLFNYSIDWAKNRDLNKIFGPKGFTPLNGLGLLTKGFNRWPAMGIPYNPGYYPVFIERLGFSPVCEVQSGYMHRDHPVPEKVSAIAEKVRLKRGLRTVIFRRRRDLRNAIRLVKTLYNGSLAGTSDNPPLTDGEVNQMANQIIWFADPKLIKVLMKDEKPVGFLMAYPDISRAIQKTKGKMFPFGWIRLMIALKTTRWININGAGIIDSYRGSGGTAILFDEMVKSVRESRYEHADLVQIGTENVRMQRELSSFGINFYKTHKMYEKVIL